MIVLLTGENEFAVDQEKQKLISTYLKENDIFGLERLDAEELESSRLRDAVLQMPFLVSKKLVIINKPFASKSVIEQFPELIAQIPDEIDVVLFDPKADKRTKLYKHLSASKQVKEFTAIKGSSLDKWVTEYAGALGSSISMGNASYLVDRVGSKQMNLAREIEKLSYASEITKQEIDQLTDQSLQSSVFDLLDKTFSGKKDQAINLYDLLLANKTDPIEVLALVAWQLHVFALVKYAGEGSSAEIASKTGLHPFVAGKAIYIARSLSTAQIKRSVESALDIDIKIKTSAIDSADAVRVLLLELSSL